MLFLGDQYSGRRPDLRDEVASTPVVSTATRVMRSSYCSASFLNSTFYIVYFDIVRFLVSYYIKDFSRYKFFFHKSPIFDEHVSTLLSRVSVILCATYYERRIILPASPIFQFDYVSSLSLYNTTHDCLMITNNHL